MGEMRVPAAAYYGASTQRAVLNFPISGYRFPRPLLRALGLIKRAAAEVNAELGIIAAGTARAIAQAAQEVADGRWDDQFVVDVFQTGSGTSTNMNANEVIANRAAELLGGARGSRLVHPNDHVNQCQSSNDTIPSAIRIAALVSIATELEPSLAHLRDALQDKAAAFDDIIKVGRTHLMDATPVRLGQEFGGYAVMLDQAIRRLHGVHAALGELPQGGTATGTGINAPAGYGRRVAEKIAVWTGLPFREAGNHFAAQGSQDALVETSGQLRTAATALLKIANDIRWLSSGPRCGIGELRLPAVQPGSSIMPGKVNPVICEAVMMVCAQVMGNDAAIAVANSHGNLELNVMLPVMAHNLLESIRLLDRACSVFADRCITGIEADRDRCQALVEWSMSMVTALAPVIGYDAASAVAKEAVDRGQTVRQVLQDKQLVPPAELDRLLDPRRMTEPG